MLRSAISDGFCQGFRNSPANNGSCPEPHQFEELAATRKINLFRVRPALPNMNDEERSQAKRNPPMPSYPRIDIGANPYVKGTNLPLPHQDQDQDRHGCQSQ